MDANYIRERAASLRREMQDLQELNARYRVQHHGHLNRLSYELWRARLRLGYLVLAAFRVSTVTPLQPSI